MEGKLEDITGSEIGNGSYYENQEYENAQVDNPVNGDVGGVVSELFFSTLFDTEQEYESQSIESGFSRQDYYVDLRNSFTYVTNGGSKIVKCIKS